MTTLNNIKREASSKESFKQAFLLGIKNALVGPAPVLVAGMLGFGAMSHGVGLSPLFSAFLSLSVFALPGQIVFVEMVSVGASASAIAFAVAITSARFLTMTLTLFPQIPKELKEPPRLVTVHLVAMSAWTYCMQEFPKLKPEQRYGYFVGIGTTCWFLCVPATLIGYWLSDTVPIWVTYALLFVNPLFFLMSFTEVPLRRNQLAILFGGLSGIYFFQHYPSNALLISGVGIGSCIYLLDLCMRKLPRRNK